MEEIKYLITKYYNCPLCKKVWTEKVITSQADHSTTVNLEMCNDCIKVFEWARTKMYEEQESKEK